MSKLKKFLIFSVILMPISFGIVKLIEMNLTNSSFQLSANVDTSISCGSLFDKFIVKYYDGDNEITGADFEFDKQYTIKVWNLSDLNCSFNINTEGTVVNTFSKYVSIDVSADANNPCISKIYTGNRLSATNKKIIQVDSFKDTYEPLIFYFTISTKYVKANVENYPERISPNDLSFNLKINTNADVIN